MMRKRLLPFFLTLLLGMGLLYTIQTTLDRLGRNPVPVGAPTPAPSGSAWTNLLEGDHVAAWKNTTDASDIFEIDGGVLHVLGNSRAKLRYVEYTNEDFGNFNLHFEVKVAPRANSGVFLRSKPNDPVYRGFEVQVIDDHGAPPNKNGTGAIYDVVSPMHNMALPAGQWNSYDISCNGKELAVSINGWPVIYTDFSRMTTPLGKFKIPYTDMQTSGTLQFQDHGGEAWYRNIYIQKLPPTEG